MAKTDNRTWVETGEYSIPRYKQRSNLKIKGLIFLVVYFVLVDICLNLYWSHYFRFGTFTVSPLWGWKTLIRLFIIYGLDTRLILVSFPVAASFLASAVVFRVFFFDPVSSDKEKTASLHGSSHWAKYDEIKESGLFNVNGATLGGWKDPKNGCVYYLRHSGPEHILAVAPTRSGKGVGLVVPTLLTWTDSVVVLDIKGENWLLSAGWRSKNIGPCLRLELTDPGDNCAKYNPLVEIGLMTTDETRDIQNIASMICDPDGKGLDDHWISNAYSLMTGAITHECYCAYNEQREPSMVNVRLTLASGDINKGLQQWLTTPHVPEQAPSEIVRIADYFLNSDLNLVDVFSRAVKALKNFQNCNYSLPDIFPNSDLGKLKKEQQLKIDAKIAEIVNGILSDDTDVTKLITAGVTYLAYTLQKESHEEIEKMKEELSIAQESAVKSKQEKNAEAVKEAEEKIAKLQKDINIAENLPPAVSLYAVSNILQECVSGNKCREILVMWKNDKLIPAHAHVTVESVANEMLQKADKELSSIVSTAVTKLSLWLDPVVVKNTTDSSFRIDDLVNYKEPVSLYVVVPPSDLTRLRPIIRLLVSQLIFNLTKRMEDDGHGGVSAKHKHQLLLMLDEAARLGKHDVLENGLSYMGGYGVKAYLIFQSYKQPVDIYGRDETLSANCKFHVVYAPNDEESAEIISKKCGHTTVVIGNSSISGKRFAVGLFGKNSESISYSQQSRDLLYPDEVKRLPTAKKNSEGKIVEPGAVLIFAAGISPIYGVQTPFFLDSEIFKRSKISAPIALPILRRNRRAYREYDEQQFINSIEKANSKDIELSNKGTLTPNNHFVDEKEHLLGVDDDDGEENLEDVLNKEIGEPSYSVNENQSEDNSDEEERQALANLGLDVEDYSDVEDVKEEDTEDDPLMKDIAYL